MFISRSSWEKDHRSRVAKGFKEWKGLKLVDVKGDPEGLLVNGPYLNEDFEKLQILRRREYYRGRRSFNVKRSGLIQIYPLMSVLEPIGVLKIQRVKPKVQPIRGKINRFSEKSRLRMIRRILQMQCLPQVFCTLTYSDDVIMNDSQEGLVRRVHKDIHDLGQDVWNSGAGVGAIWRIEYKARKSGLLSGWMVPHVHFLFYGITKSNCRAVGERFRRAWLRYTGSKNEAAERVTMHSKSWITLDTRGRVMSYVSKYTAKESEDEGFDTGRHWGQFGVVPKAEAMVIEVDRDEFKHVRRVLDKWIRSRSKKDLSDYVLKQTVKGNRAYVHLKEMDMVDLLELAFELGELPF